MDRTNPTKQNVSLVDVESSIVALVGDDIDTYNLDKLSFDDIETVAHLLAQRKQIINELFKPTAENMARFSTVNRHLFELTQNLHNRFKIMETKATLISDCPDFDDDYVVKGWLRYVFDKAESVVALPDDAYYGSRFALMIKTLYELYEYKGLEDIESVYPTSEPLDDTQSWDEPPFCGIPEFKDIVICHAVHDLTNHKAYSIPDLLRLNDFWCEVQVRVQSLTDQKGNHWKNGNYE